ncbi:scarecrow-like protein 6 [Carex rostrata]
MRGMPYPAPPHRGGLELQAPAASLVEEEEPTFAKRQKFACVREGFQGIEPRSVLDHHTSSPSPPTSSSSLGGGGVAAVSDHTHEWPDSAHTANTARGKEEWALSDLHPLPPGAAELGPEWEAMLSDSAAPTAFPGGQEQSFLRWIMGETEESAGKPLPLGFEGNSNTTSNSSGNAGMGFGLVDPAGLVVDPIQLQPQLVRPPGLFLQEPTEEEKPVLFSAPQNLLLSQQQQPHAGAHPSFFLPMQTDLQSPMANPSFFLPPQLKRPHPMAGNTSCHLNPHTSGPGPELFLRRNQMLPSHQAQMFAPPLQIPQQRTMLMKPKAETENQVPPPLVEQLLEAAKMVETGNASGARGILARLNHQLPVPAGKPLLRASFYFKEALNQILSGSASAPSSPVKSLYDVAMKFGAHKAFNELSPVLHFTNFTSVQALLDELGAADRIHIIDFDIGIGGQWSSFMQEIAQRRCTATGTGSITVLKMTAFVTPSSHHLLELHLIRDNLCQFANDLNIPFEFNILSLESFDPSELLAMGGSSEAIAVNLPVSSVYGPSFPTLLRLVKQLCPRILISIDHGCDRGDLPFSPHFYHAFQSYVSLLDSLDSVGPNMETAHKIERFVLLPRIEGSVVGRHRMGDKMLPWRTLFASAGYTPLPFSNMAEAQAECLAKRVQVKDFHVDRRQGSLVLYWHHGEIVSITAWKGC